MNTTTTPPPLRLGLVRYLNMWPFVHGLGDVLGGGNDGDGGGPNKTNGANGAGPQRAIEPFFGTPAELGQWLAEGLIDCGMAPVASLFANPEWTLAGRTMIGARGPVASVLLVGFDPAIPVETLSADSHSMTSNALARIILAGRYGQRAIAAAPPIDKHAGADMLYPYDSAHPFVLIGERANAWRATVGLAGAAPDAEGFLHIPQRKNVALDLGAAWTAWTGLPFVFAAWACRADCAPGAALARVEALLDRNLGRLREIAPLYGRLPEEGLTGDKAHDYLARNIAYDLTDDAIEGILRYYQEGCSLGLFREGWALHRADGALSPAD